MKRNALCGAVLLLAGTLLAADSDSKMAAENAAKKLADQPNYSWKTTTETTGRFRPGPTEGQTEKNGYTVLSMTQGDNTTEAVLKDGKGAFKNQEGWQGLSEAAEGGDGQPNWGRFLARRLQNYKLPAAQAQEILSKAKDLQMTDGAYTGDLTAKGAEDLMFVFGRPPGDNGPTISGAKGNVKFWVKDGVLSKYQYRVQGSMNWNNNDIDVDRTTTVEINDVGSTKVKVPEEAKSKIS